MHAHPPAAGLKVIVIGGGVAGLKAAADLQRGGADVTVLEARDRWGGSREQLAARGWAAAFAGTQRAPLSSSDCTGLLLRLQAGWPYPQSIVCHNLHTEFEFPSSHKVSVPHPCLQARRPHPHPHAADRRRGAQC